MANPNQKLRKLEQDVQRFTKAYLSDYPRPIDYTNLLDAQYALNALKSSMGTAPKALSQGGNR